jgi:asparagine synthase (glutamine-hydrolysing)
VALAARRLAIIDLGEAGHQPFASDDGQLQLIYNGEVYNYPELRATLLAFGHCFRTETDTEVVLAAYRQWGKSCVERFNGMWAFALWDGRRRQLFCSRDRFGIKPFYYRIEGGRFLFASELKAFAADPNRRLAPNLRVIRDYLEYARLDHSDETFFMGIHSLPAAHTLVFDEHGLRLQRYWRLEPGDALADDAATAVRELLFDSVKLRLRADVPVGVCLSGGIDSSTIACAVRKLQPVVPQKTFTVCFGDAGFEERPYAEAVVTSTEAQPHWISFSASELVESLPAVIKAQDEPFNSTSIVAQWYLMRAARQAGVKVMLDGQGSDEIFAGYDAFFGERFADLLVRGQLRELSFEFNAFRRETGARLAWTVALTLRPFAPEAVQRRLKSRLTGSYTLVHPDLRTIRGVTVEDSAAFSDRLRRRLSLMTTRRAIPELLHSEDRNSMTHSVEARLPYLDHRLVELVFSLSGGELITGGRTKAVLRRALGDLLPKRVLNRSTKLGFPTPEGRFFREKLGELAMDVFASRSFAERGWVDVDAACHRLRRHRASQIEAGFELWRPLNLELWARTFIDRAH